MKIECNKCKFEFDHYNNIYGTRCPKCDNFILPIGEPKFIKKYKFNIKKMQEKFLNKLKKER